jgi:UDP-GlcNAc:undecaprenyl-phosphate GlcNAc-1-phosphate transferase
MGLADDAYNTKPFLKFSAQLFCGFIMIITDNYIQISPYEWFNYTLTILWVAGLMNSINMLDNMDAIATIVTIFIILMMLCVLAINHNYNGFEFFVLLGVGAGLIGFLFHNWYPSKMFMGDTGSQFLGVFLAWFSIKLLWNSHDFQGEPIQFKQFSCVLIAFALPLIDTGIVSINRIRKGKSPFVGGKDHTTHHLGYIGLSDSQVAMVFIGLSSISLFIIIAILRFIQDWGMIYTFLCAGYFVFLFIVFFYITMIGEKKIIAKNEN